MAESDRNYPWLTVREDGSYGVDMKGATSAESDRRLVIAQELHAGRVVLPGEPALAPEEVELAASALEFASTYALQPDLAADVLAKKLRTSPSLRAPAARWVQLFNKLEKHVSRHFDTKTAVGFNDDADDVLHRGWRQVMKDATQV